MRYFVAKTNNPEFGGERLHPDWFSVAVSDNGFSEIACEEFLKTRDAKRTHATIVEVEITEIK